MLRNDLKKLITAVLSGDYESAAYQEYRMLTFRKKFSQENSQDILSLAQSELKQQDLKNPGLVWDLYLYAREEINPLDPRNIISITSGMLHNSRYAFNIRALYFWHGVKCEVDYTRAHELLLEARRLGHVAANYNLGRLCQLGLGRPKNYAKARFYYEEAAQQQYPFAYRFLGTLAKNGLGGFKKDRLQAIEFFKIAVELGDKDALRKLSNLAYAMYPKTHEGIDSKQTIPIFTFIAEYDHPPALTTLGTIHLTQKKYLTARWLFERSSKFNHMTGLYNLAAIYRDGLGVERNLSLAMHYFKRALKTGSKHAYLSISNLYNTQEFGYNKVKAIKYLEKGVANNEISCIINLAYSYAYAELGLQKDVAKSVTLNKRGIELSSATCHYNLALFRFRNKTFAISIDEAYQYLNYAIAAGEPKACKLRAELYVMSNQHDLAAKFYRKELYYHHDDDQYQNIKQRFADMARKGSVIQDYHWYMTDVTETLSQEILNLYKRHPWKIIQEILNDDIIDQNSKINYLKQLPGTFLAHINALSVDHPIRIQLNNLYEYCKSDLIDDLNNDEIDQSAFLDKVSELATVVNDPRLPAYLTMTTLFDAVLNDAIEELEMPRVLASIYQCHKTIMHVDHAAAEQTILVDYAQQSYMSLDAYLHILSAHLALIEAYVTLLQEEIVKITCWLSRKQKFALVNAHGILTLTDALLDPSKHKQHDKLSGFSEKIKSINTSELWLSLKKKTQNTNEHVTLNQAMQFFHAGKEKYLPIKQASPSALRRIFNSDN